MNVHRMANIIARRASFSRPSRPTMMTSVSTTRFYGITYSGGQASEGQGGYYGSGGARKTKSPPPEEQNQEWKRPQMLALAGDVEKITQTMNEVISLEELLREISSDTPTSKTIEIKSKMKKICTHPEFVECLNRLEIDGEPVWGLSSEERNLITDARRKVNNC